MSANYLNLLRRIPDDVIRSMATREYDMDDAMRCVCGWAVRDDLLRAIGRDDEWLYNPVGRCVDAFGGSLDEWDDIYHGVLNPERIPDIEKAFVQRLDEAVEASR